MNKFIGITGTTGVGKSAVAVELAKKINGQIISADSMQIYKGMDIGTAKISSDEMMGIPHYMIDILEPNQDFSSYLFGEYASKIIFESDKPSIVVGGTGLYFESLMYPPEFNSDNEAQRDRLKNIYEKKGLEKLVNILKETDIEAYNVVDLHNPKRVIRAIEIAQNGQSITKGTARNREPRIAGKIFILQTDRNKLYRHIDERVDNMIEKGLVEEVKNLVEKYGYLQNSAFSAIGYKEIIEYLQNKCSLTEAIEKIKLNTRHYAKRQISFFKRLNFAEYVDVENRTIDEITKYILKNA